MTLNIVVCIKQVPDPKHFSEITMDPVKHTIRREGIPSVINPCDRHALEEGLRIREKFTGKLVVISMGPTQALEALQEALAIGADEAILLCDKAFAGSDTLVTSYVLGAAIGKIGAFDLVLCGNETVDGGTGHVGAQLAELLGIPHVQASNIKFIDERSLTVKMPIEHGYLDISLKLPAVISVTEQINRYRLPTVWAIVEVAGREIKIWDCEDLEVDTSKVGSDGSPTEVTGIFEHKFKRRVEFLRGSPEEMAKQAVVKLRQLGGDMK